jgi:hypothetical protein
MIISAYVRNPGSLFASGTLSWAKINIPIERNCVVAQRLPWPLLLLAASY